MRTLFDRPHEIRYISHRGFQPMAPANSLPSFEYAGVLRQWAIETDVRMTRDGMLVCCHDPVVETAFDGEGSIEQMTWAQLDPLRMNKGNRLDCLEDEQKRMPLFSQYLSICKQVGSVPFIELKTSDVKPVLEAVHAAGLEDGGVVMSSSNLDWLLNTRKQAKDMFIHWIFADDKRLDELASAGNAGLSFNVPNAFDCPRQRIDATHDMGLKVCLRAGDTLAAVRHMLALGLDYIPSNCMHIPLL